MAVARIAKVHIREGSNKDFEAKFNELLNEMRTKEPAAIYHILHRSRKDPSTYIIYEQYTDDAAMVGHGRTRHFNMLGIQLGNFFTGDALAEIELVDVVENGSLAR